MSQQAATVWGEIDGRAITFPFEVRDANMATLMFSVPSADAAALLPGAGFEIAETVPGMTQFLLALCDYRENPWGDYNEVSLGFLARPAGGPPESIGSFVYRMPVDQPFTCKAGNQVMGFPKTVEEIEFDYSDDNVRVRLAMDGIDTLSLRFPRVPPAGAPGRVEAVSYSYLDGAPYATDLAMDVGTGLVDPARVEIEIGTGPVADELRSLGLPTAPDLCIWGEGLGAIFQLGRPL